MAASGRAQQVLGIALAVAGALAALGGLVAWLTPGEADAASWHEPSAGGLWVAIAGALLSLVGVVLFARGHGRAHDLPLTFLSPEDEDKVLDAIERFEKKTSGELRVHLAYHARGEILDEARRTFEALGLTATRERNAVLFYVAVHDHRFAVLGDAGINEKVASNFWDDVVSHVRGRFVEQRFGDGLVEGIALASEALATHFPARADDMNELPNTLSTDRS